MYGMETTGVRSFGDLAANFGGMGFYRDLLYGPNPFLRCIGGRYSRVRAFDWADYVNSAWDEAINCSEFGPGLRSTVTRNLATRGVTCPVAVTECEGLAALPCSSHYVSPACQRRWISSEPGGVCEPALADLPVRAPVSRTPATSPSPPCPPGTSAPSSPGLIDRTMNAISDWWNS